MRVMPINKKISFRCLVFISLLKISNEIAFAVQLMQQRGFNEIYLVVVKQALSSRNSCRISRNKQ